MPSAKKKTATNRTKDLAKRAGNAKSADRRVALDTSLQAPPKAVAKKQLPASQGLQRVFQSFWQWANTHWAELLVVCLLVTVKIVIQGYNFLGYPYIENDEATYVLRGLSFAQNGSFDIYTYWYDHAPAGWMLLGAWFAGTGKALLFGSYVASARFFMLIIGAITTVLTYVLARRVLKNRVHAFIATLVVILSPLELYYQRRVLLDNMMTLWILVSFVFATRKKVSIGGSFWSAVSLGLAIMTKINALFFAPAILYAIWKNTSERIRLMSTVVWFSTVGSIVALFPIYALLKGELLPVNDHPETGDFSKGISLIDTLIFQSSRGGDQTLPPWSSNSDFFLAVAEWFSKDAMFVIFSFFGLATLVWLRNKNNRQHRAGLLALTFAYLGMLLFIMRGGVVLEFYFLPIFPIVAIVGIAGLMMPIYTRLIRTSALRIFYQIAVISLVCLNYFMYIPFNDAFSRNEVSNQLKAVEWIRANVDQSATIVTDNYATVYLQFEQGYENTDYNYKVEYDPELRERLRNDWRNIDYIIATHEVIKQMKLGATPFVKDAFDHAVLEASFVDNSTSYINIPNYISTNGDWAQVWRIKDDNEIILQDSWDTFVDEHFVEYGQIIDPAKEDITTSLMQTNAMLRAIEDGDRAAFRGIWSWTRDHFQNRLQDNLLSSSWEKDPDGTYGITDANTTTLADIQAAYALLRAYESWGSPGDLEDAQAIIDDIWRQEIFQIEGRYIVSAYATNQLNQVLVNPSYLAIPAFKAFAKVDAAHNWLKVADDSYWLLAQLQNPKTGLIPNWTKPNGVGGFVSARSEVGQVSDWHGYESFRIPYWLALDYEQYEDQRAKRLLAPLAAFLQQEMDKSGRIVAAYTLNGKNAVDFEDVAPYGAAYLALYYDDAQATSRILNEKIVGQYNWHSGKWGSEQAAIINDMWLPLVITHVSRYHANETDYPLLLDYERETITLLDEFGNPLPAEDQPAASNQ